MTSFFSTESQYIGVDAGEDSLRLATIRKRKKIWEIVSLKEFSTNTDPSILASFFKGGIAVSTIKGRDLLVRHCQIPLGKRKSVFEALNFHVEPLLPYPSENAVIQAQLLKSTPKSTDLTVFASRKDHLTEHLEGLKKHSIEPEIVTTPSLALAAFSTLLLQNEMPALLIHESEDEVNIVLVEKGRVLASRSVDPTQQNFGTDIKKTFLNFTSAYPAKDLNTIYFIGKNPEFKKCLEDISQQPLQRIACPTLRHSEEELIQFALAIGTAIAHQEVNFRQKEFAYPHQFRRLKKPLTTFFTLAALLGTSIILLGQHQISSQKQAIETAYFSLLNNENLDLKNTPKTCSEYAVSLKEIENQLRARPDTYPLLPKVPAVKEVMSALTSIIEQIDPSQIEIESFHYQMVNRPDFSHKKQKYKVRCELELCSQNAQGPRTFYEKLKQKNEWVDQKEDIQWLQEKGKYKVIFYLKDNTRYFS